MSASEAVPVDPPGRSGRPTPTDWLFLVSLLATVALIVVLGRMSYREAIKTEHAKAQAEALVAWFRSASAERNQEAFGLPPCARRESGQATEGGKQAPNWGECREALLSEQGPLSAQRNAFSGESIGFVDKCDPADRKTAGQIVIERNTATPLGSAVPVVVTGMADGDGIDRVLNLRVTVCDRGGYPVRVAETDF